LTAASYPSKPTTWIGLSYNKRQNTFLSGHFNKVLPLMQRSLNMKQVKNYKDLDKTGKTLIFRPWITDRKTGKRIYPKSGKVFPLWV
jgi:hypothetical protein